MADILLNAINLSIEVQNLEGHFKAVDEVSFKIRKGEILGLVGESGCGKTLTALSIPGLLGDQIKITNGQILFKNKDLTKLPEDSLCQLRGKDISFIFQEPMTSLNPVVSIGKQVEEPLLLHTSLNKKERHEKVLQVLTQVGLPQADKLLKAYPHELSGGMRQRVMIAMAVICSPSLVIADEPTTALDVTLQAQTIQLLKQINRDFGCSILFISHDLGVVSQLCHRVAVMYAGKIVEEGKTERVFQYPGHEYTKGLLNSLPTPEKKGQLLEAVAGKVPSLQEEKKGCPFAPRCDKATAECFLLHPLSVQFEPEHFASCILVKNVREKVYAPV